MMDVGFLHIGMMKTASTYMQNLWLRDEAYALSWRGNIDFLQELRKAVKAGDLKQKLNMEIKTDAQYQEGQKLVISNEGFSSAFMNEVDHQSKIPQFINYTSQMLGELSNLTSNLLLVVREPFSWIKSVYVQAIKQGWSGSAQDFVEVQKNLISHSLDLEHIVGCYGRYFDNILILPFEILKEDEDYFWQIISEKFSLPLLKARMGKVNQSLDLKRTYLLSKLNKTSGILLDTLINSKNYKNTREKNRLVNMYSEYGKWVHRRFVEHADEKQLKLLYQIYNNQDMKIPGDFLKFTLSAGLLESIKSNYIGFLNNIIEQKYIDLYKDKFNEYA